MKKLLFLAYKNVCPVVSGEKIRMMQNIKFLSMRYEVDVAMLSEAPLAEKDLKHLHTFVKRVFTFKQAPIWLKAWRCFANILAKKPIQNGYFYSKQMHRFVKNHYQEYDVIFCENLRTAQYAYNLEGPLKILDAPDCSTLNSLNEANSSRGLRKLLFKIDYRNTHSFESTHYRRFNAVFLICDRDQQAVVDMDGSLKDKAFLLFNYSRDLGYKPENVPDRYAPSAAFLGRVKYGPNVAAINYFVDEIIPEIRKVYPSFVFHVYGGDVPESMKRLEETKPIVFHGFVEDVAKEIQSHPIVVAPMVSGSGTQNKILECMLLHQCVITTKIGADGLVELDEDALIVTDSTEELTERCFFYLDPKNEGKRQAVGDAAAQYVSKVYSEDIARQQLYKVLDALDA